MRTKHPLDEFLLHKLKPGLCEWAYGGVIPQDYEEEISIWNQLHGHHVLLSTEDHPIDNVIIMEKIYITQLKVDKSNQ